VGNIDLRELGCENWRRMQVAQNRVQWRALVLVVLNISGSAKTVIDGF
jgi:hypothetical protein